jgi:hypothetical protein
MHNYAWCLKGQSIVNGSANSESFLDFLKNIPDNNKYAMYRNKKKNMRKL